MLFLHIRNFSVLLHVKCHDFNVPVIQAFRNQREGIGGSKALLAEVPALEVTVWHYSLSGWPVCIFIRG